MQEENLKRFSTDPDLLRMSPYRQSIREARLRTWGQRKPLILEVGRPNAPDPRSILNVCGSPEKRLRTIPMYRTQR
jgi:hypothetical protein